MISKKLHLEYILPLFSILLLLSPLAQSYIPQTFSDDPLKEWNANWSHRQAIQPSIDTSSRYAKYQPIDINVKFTDICWGMNESIHSIRVCCWNGSEWDELESQIYNLEFSDESHIYSCNIIFLVPSYATGSEQYYVYYDESETSIPQYPDHISIRDAYYYYEPIAGISVEGDYYEISDDGEIVYGVGQKGKVMNRRLSQIAIRMKPGTEEFDILNSDLLTSFCFSYQEGEDDEDEVASDYMLIGKEITVNGPLMSEFIIISESEYGRIRTTNAYRYYHTPSPDKRITVHVKHEIFCDLQVKGLVDNDGRYGSIISYYSKSDSMKKMRFGDILPYLHVYSKQERVNEYELIENPESNKREWVISTDDDCDLGSAAWLSYSEGVNGKTHGLIFSSNEHIISNTTEERDGIQLRVTEKEYLDLVGAEIDYASISFGRNSYDPLHAHDLVIDKGLQIEFDVEFITIQQGSYEDIHQESIYFQNLVSYRDVSKNEIRGKQYIHTLTVVPHLSGRLGSFPLLVNYTNLPLPILYAELWMDNTLQASAQVQKSLLGFQLLKFPKLCSGEYTIKLYRMFRNTTRFIGIGFCNLTMDTALHIYGTWEKTIDVQCLDQNNQFLSNITIQVTQGSHLISDSMTKNELHMISLPFPFLDSYIRSETQNPTLDDLFHLSKPYDIKAWYKGFKIYDQRIGFNEKSITLNLPVYDIIVSITDELNLAPSVNVNPFLTSDDMNEITEILPDKHVNGKFYFLDLPEAAYNVYISYGGYSKSKTINVPSDGDLIEMRFSYMTDLSVELLTIRGEVFEDENLRIEIKRLGNIVENNLPHNEILHVPPGRYTVNVYENNELIGSQQNQVSYDTIISVVTTRGSFVQIVFIVSAFLLLGVAFLLLITQYITLNMFLKLVVLGIVFFSLVQPWWSFSGKSDDESMKKTSDMYLFPQIMIEQFQKDDTRKLSIATIPEMFLNFLFYLSVIIGFGMILMFTSFVPNIILKKRFSFLLAIISIVFVLIVAISFYLGMSSITEISLGSIQGNGMIDVTIPSGEKIYMDASWGLGLGFYTILFAASISLSTGIYDIIKSQKKWIESVLHSKRIKKK